MYVNTFNTLIEFLRRYSVSLLISIILTHEHQSYRWLTFLELMILSTSFADSCYYYYLILFTVALNVCTNGDKRFFTT